MPAWLGWTSKQWHAHGNSWYDAVDAALSVETYLEKYFHAGVRKLAAKRELDTAEAKYKAACQEGGAEHLLEELESARIWKERVELWSANMEVDLVGDSVASPSADGKRWLLYLPGAV